MEEALGEKSLSDLWHIVEGGARPLALLHQVLPERLRTEEVQTCASDLKLNTRKESMTTPGAATCLLDARIRDRCPYP